MKKACAACRRLVNADRQQQKGRASLSGSFFGAVALFVFFLHVFLFGRTAFAVCPSFSDLIGNGSYAVGDKGGKLLSGCNVDTPYIPASILKISTALAGFSLLGADYRFATAFYQDSRNNLYIKGTGDPLLISEEVSLIIAALKERGVSRMNGIFVDSSNFALEHQAPGREDSANPYDAPVGAVAVNFNSVPVRVSSTRRVVSSEPQTPTLPIMRQTAKNYLPGTYRINVCAGSCQPEQQMARYTTELFRALQRQAKIPGTGKTGILKVPADARLVYLHKSTKDLAYLVESFLKYSSNFISNLIYLACGTARYGYPATWEKADRAVHEVLVQQLGEQTAARIKQMDGAGLSRENRLTARTMLALLQVFRPHANLLRKRRGVLTKSGSMKGIYNYAGYLRDGKGFVIMLNQSRNTRGSVLERLKKGRFPVTVEEKR